MHPWKSVNIGIVLVGVLWRSVLKRVAVEHASFTLGNSFLFSSLVFKEIEKGVNPWTYKESVYLILVKSSTSCLIYHLLTWWASFAFSLFFLWQYPPVRTPYWYVLDQQTHFYVNIWIRSVVEKITFQHHLSRDVLTMCFCVVGGLRCYLCFAETLEVGSWMSKQHGSLFQPENRCEG